MTSALTAPDPPIQYINVSGVRLAYRESGTPGQPVMVLLHGLAETSAFFWRPLIAHFEAHYHIYAFDLPGHGDSDDLHDGYEASHQAWLIAQALNDLDATPAVFLGHSFGGILSAHIAINWPYLVERLVLYDTPMPDNVRNNIVRLIRYTPLSAALIMGPLVLPLIARTVFSFIPVRLILKMLLIGWRVPYHPDRINQEFLEQAERHSGTALVEMAQVSFMKINLVKDLNQLSMPTCVIVGDSDLIAPVGDARRWVRLIPDARLVVIPNAGHVSLLDDPDAFNRALEEFLG